MGIYLGQLPPAELARLKAELAETLIANFCYPRFFDYRTQSLRMRPVDRAKRQEVWLYLSSVDFTTWNRVDVMSPDFQRQLERLFIQFVQRNRSFFGEQGRKRMSDVRMLIGSSASTVTQGLRAHIAGQRPTGVAPFGSPRPVLSWSPKNPQSQQEASWEKIAAATLLLQQQLLEARGGGSMNGEARAPLANNGHVAPSAVETPPANGTSRRVVRPQPATKQEPAGAPAASMASSTPTSRTPMPGQGAARPSAPLPEPKPQPAPSRSAAPAASVATPQPGSAPTAPTPKQAEVASTGATKPAPPAPPMPSQVAQGTQPQPLQASQMTTSRSAQTQQTPIEQANTAVTPVTRPATARDARIQAQSPLAKVAPAAAPSPSAPQAPSSPPPTPPVTPLASTSVASARSMVAPTPTSAASVAPTSRDNLVMRVGDDDIAIFEQMRHQMIVWLRIEVVRAGLDLASQTPSQLLELLRQQDHMDETRLQVVSTLLNLANQVINSGQVSVLDYKQALMFHLMHTRR